MKMTLHVDPNPATITTTMQMLNHPMAVLWKIDSPWATDPPVFDNKELERQLSEDLLVQKCYANHCINGQSVP